MKYLHACILVGGLTAAGCSGGPETGNSGCQNVLGSSCQVTIPEGVVRAEPASTSEGKTLTFHLDIFDTDPEDKVTCELDPLGNGIFPFKGTCPTSVNYVYQESGPFSPKVKAADSQENELERTAAVTVAEASGNGSSITKFRLFDKKLFPVRNARFCIRPVVSPSGCLPINVTEGPPPGTYFVVPRLPQDTPAANPFKIIVTQGSANLQAVLIGRVDADNTRNEMDFSLPFDCPPSSQDCTDADEDDKLGILSGTVTSQTTGAPILGAEISLLALGTGEELTVPGVSGENGQYEVTTVSKDSAALKETVVVRVRADEFQEAISTVVLDFVPEGGDEDNKFNTIYFFGFNFSLEPLP